MNSENLLKKLSLIFILGIITVVVILIIMSITSGDSSKKKPTKEPLNMYKSTRVKDDNSNLDSDMMDQTTEKENTEEESLAEGEETTQNLEENTNDEEVVENDSDTIDSTETEEYAVDEIDTESVSLKIGNSRLYIGDTTTITGNNPAEGITFTSSDNTIATVSNDGKVTAISKGTCYVTASSENSTKDFKIVVLSADPNYQPPDIQMEDSETESTLENTNIASDSTQSKTETTESRSDGWYTINNKKYYYKNNQPLKNTYVDYIYLNSKGVAQKKKGNFDATLYGAVAWPNRDLDLQKKANMKSQVITTIPGGTKIKILSAENPTTKYIKVKYNNQVGYVPTHYLYINLPDIMPDIIYNITNAEKSIYKASGKNIPGITGKNLYGFTKTYNEKIGKTTYYAPLLYPVSKQLKRAYHQAKKDGYNLKIYDSYRPQTVSKKLTNKFQKFYDANPNVRNSIDYDWDGYYWGPSSFLAADVSMHNRGSALDLTLINKNGKEIKAQSNMHTLDTTSLRKYDNKAAKKLKKYMTNAGFETIESEWWHFEEYNYRTTAATSIKIN